MNTAIATLSVKPSADVIREGTRRYLRRISKRVRAHCGQTGTPYPIVIVPGFRAPHLEGHGYYWTTPSGKTIVRHPNAYRWPTLYHHSTRRIVVGAGWLIRREMIDG